MLATWGRTAGRGRLRRACRGACDGTTSAGPPGPPDWSRWWWPGRGWRARRRSCRATTSRRWPRRRPCRFARDGPRGGGGRRRGGRPACGRGMRPRRGGGLRRARPSAMRAGRLGGVPVAPTPAADRLPRKLPRASTPGRPRPLLRRPRRSRRRQGPRRRRPHRRGPQRRRRPRCRRRLGRRRRRSTPPSGSSGSSGETSGPGGPPSERPQAAAPRAFLRMSAICSSIQSPGSRDVTISLSPRERRARSSGRIVSAA